MKRIKPIILILLAALLARLYFFFDYHLIWWDSAVYIGMGKYIFSFAKQGLWEPLRPIVWPVILGLIWKIKLDPLFFGRLLNLFLSLGAIYLTYRISEKIFDKKTAIIASIIFSFSAIFFFSTFHLYTEIASIFFVLLATYLLLKQKYFFAGILFGIGFLTKFPVGIFIVPAFIFLLLKNGLKIKKQNILDSIYLSVGFIISLSPYLILNQLLYSNPLLPFIEGSQVITQVLGCNYFEYLPWYSYFLLISTDNILNIFALFGIYTLIKNRTKEKLLIFFFMLLPLLYFIQLNCRSYRYIILFLPFLVILSGYGLSTLLSKLNKKKFFWSLIIILIISMSFAVTYYAFAEQPKQEPWQYKEFFRYAEGEETQGEIWISNPIIGLYNDKNLKLVYYPRFGAEIVPSLQNYFEKNYTKISYVFLDTCDGGLLCRDEDQECQKQRTLLINTLKYNFNQAYYKQQGECEYYIFKEK